MTVTINKADIASGGMKSFKQDDDSIILITRDGDEFYAFDGKCPHAGANLGDGLRCGNRVVCPWHHATFDSTDGSLLEPVATEGLTQYQIEDRGDTLIVDTSAKITKNNPHDKLKNTTTVIVGSGAAGFMSAHHLRNEGYGGKIIMISADDHAPYDRTLLSKAFLAEKADEKKLKLGGNDWANKQNIDLRLSQRVSSIDYQHKTVTVAGADDNADNKITADFLVIATGAEPVIPPIKGATSNGVFTLRSLDDTKTIKDASHGKRVAIIGTGFIGMEVASALAQAGKVTEITVIGQNHRVMSNIVSETVSNALINLHEKNGITFEFDATVQEINSDDNEKVTGITFANGQQIATDVVILGTGVAPRLEVLGEINDPNGAQVDARLQLKDGVFALGDIANAESKLGRLRIEHWRVALQHGLVTAASILNDDILDGHSVDSLKERVPFFWTMQYGKSLRYSGHAKTPDHGILMGQPNELNYIEFYFDDDGQDSRATAASTLGRDKELVAFDALLRRGVAPTRAQLLAGFDIIAQAQALSS